MDKATMDYLTLGIAVLGAALGVLNYWRAWSTDRVRLRVRPAYSVDTSGGRYLSVEVVNLSTFAVTVNAVGLDTRSKDFRMEMPGVATTQGERLPIRLESRAAFTLLFPFGAFERAQLAAAQCAYAKTECGHRSTGVSAAFRDIVKIAATP